MGSMESFPCLDIWNNQIMLLKYRVLNAEYIVLSVSVIHPFGSWIVESSAKMLHKATFFIVCHLHVCNLSPVLSKQCNAHIMPGLSRIMCQCFRAAVRDASPIH